MRLLHFTIVLCTILGSVSCDLVEDIQGMTEKQQVIQADIAVQTNLKTQVGWNIHNGTLTNVTILFDAAEVGDRTVSDLVAIVKPIVIKHFEQTPQAIIVSVVVNLEGLSQLPELPAKAP